MSRMHHAALLVLLVSGFASLDAQEVTRAGYQPLGPDAVAPGLDAPVWLTSTAPLRFVVKRIADQANLGLVFDDSLPGLDDPTTVRFVAAPARTALEQALARTPLRALVSPGGQLVLVRRTPKPTRLTRVTGVIREAGTGAPVSGARVELVGTRFTAYSHDDGSFVLAQIPLDGFVLRVARIGYEPLSVTIPRASDDGQRAPLQLELRRATLSLAEIVVTPGYFGLLQSSLATPQSLTREQLETVPQIGEDIYRAVARLPGVTADDYSAKFSVRGGSGDELYVSLDGLELVEPFHLKDVGGAFSIIDIQALGSASLTTGGFSAEYGDRLAGVFTLTTAEPRTDRVHTSLGISVMNARATAQGGFAGGKGGWLVSARPGYLDVALKLTDIRDSLKPRYYDLFAKAQYDLGRGGLVAVHALHANDSFKYLEGEGEPNISSRYRSSYLWLTWDGKVGSRLRARTVASAGALDWRRSGVQIDRAIPEVEIRDDRSLDRLALRQDWTLDVSPRLLLKWGLDAKRESASYDYFSAVSEHARGAGSSDAVDTTMSSPQPRSTKTAFYLAPRVQLLSSLTLELGIRHDRNSQLGEAITSPRVNLAWQPASGTTIRGAWGRYSQWQQLVGLQAQDGVSTFSPAQRAEQRILGVEQTLPFGITGRVEGYERRVTRSSPEYVNVGGDVLLFPEVSWDRMRLERTGGRDRGIELQASRSQRGRMDWSLSYALSRSEDSVAGKLVPRAADQRHALHGDWSLRPANNSWRLSVGAVWHSGWPYTPTVLVVDTLVNTDAQFRIAESRHPGELNSLRLRSYRRVDVRWTRYIDTRRGRLSIFGEVYNLLDTVNQRGVYKDLRVSGRGVLVVTQDIEQWPRLPLAGLSWEF